MQIQLGIIPTIHTERMLTVDEIQLKQHLAVFGGTRQGKSKLFERICRELIENGQGFAFIDPHSDTADDLLSYIASNYPQLEGMLPKIHYIRPDDRVFRFDPFRFRPEGEESEYRYRNWLHTKIKDMTSIICRQQGSTEEEVQKYVRMKRWMYNALYAVGVRQDSSGIHLPLSDALILINTHHKNHDDRYQQVAPHLSDDVRADFELLHSIKDPYKQSQFTESTVNRLRDILSPVVQRIFDSNGHEPALDFRQIIQNNEVILASLGKTEEFHEEVALAIAGLIIREISGAVRTVPRENRKQFYLFIDEAQHFLGEDMLMLLKESGKYRLSFGLAVQGLDNLQKGTLDLAPAVLGQCGLRVTFRQQFHEHAEVLAKSMCYPMLNFTELMHEVERDDGYEWVLVSSESNGEATGVSFQVSRTESANRSVASQTGVGYAYQESSSLAVGHGTGVNRGIQLSAGTGQSSTRTGGVSVSLQNSKSQNRDVSLSAGESRSISENSQQSSGNSLGESTAHGTSRHPSASLPTKSENVGQVKSQNTSATTGTAESMASQRTASISEGNGSSVSQGITASGSNAESNSQNASVALSRADSEHDSTTSTAGGAQTISGQKSESETHGTGEANSVSIGTNIGKTHSISTTPTPLHKVRVELQRTGRLEKSVEDQFAEHTAKISSLNPQHCLVAVASLNTAFVLRVADVFDPFEQRRASASWRKNAILKLKERMYALQPYFVATPDYRPLENRGKPTPPAGPESSVFL